MTTPAQSGNPLKIQKNSRPTTSKPTLLRKPQLPQSTPHLIRRNAMTAPAFPIRVRLTTPNPSREAATESSLARQCQEQQPAHPKPPKRGDRSARVHGPACTDHSVKQIPQPATPPGPQTPPNGPTGTHAGPDPDPPGPQRDPKRTPFFHDPTTLEIL